MKMVVGKIGEKLKMVVREGFLLGTRLIKGYERGAWKIRWDKVRGPRIFIKKIIFNYLSINRCRTPSITVQLNLLNIVLLRKFTKL